MKSSILILRPEPGASESAARARALGLEPVVAPLFEVRPVAWDLPESAPEALLLTSANAARRGGPQLATLRGLPCYAVGEATAEAAGAAGFEDVRIGPSDGAAAVEMMAADGVRRALHLCGRDHVPLQREGISIERRIVYEAVAADRLPPAAADALENGALVLLHSPRAAATFAALVPERSAVRLAAISKPAAQAAGEGWAAVAVAPEPRDQPLLELAARLCHSGSLG